MRVLRPIAPCRRAACVVAITAALGCATGWPPGVTTARADTPSAPACSDPGYPALTATSVLDNERVRVHRVVLPPGSTTGPGSPASDRLTIYVRGGTLVAAETGRATVWHEGRVEWFPAGVAPPARRNSGSTPIEWVSVCLKPVPPGRATAVPPAPLAYPNIPGEDLLENDAVIVQRFIVAPGQWEGVHAHVPNMLYVHLHGGQWAARSYREPEHPYPRVSPDGSVGWMAPVPLSEGHESGNIGPAPIDLVWVTLKR